MGRSTFDNSSKCKSASASQDEMLAMQMQSMFMPQNDPSRIVFLHGDVNEHSISSVVMQLLQLANQNHKPIHLVISTYGGSIDEMFSLYDTIKFLPCPVHTVAMGKVMSAGVLLLASGAKGKRMIGKSARIMIHPVTGGIWGNVFEAMNEAQEHVRLQEMLELAMVRETKLTQEKVSEIMKTCHDFYLTPEQAIEFGIVDKIIGNDK